jgi:DNA gyrase/topoisomerase IV subunit B
MSIDKYDASKIQVLEPLEAIRKRPAMYAGPLDDPTLPSRLILESCCIALESAKKGEVTEISIDILSDNSARVKDNGPGWPTGMAKCGKNWVYLIMTAIAGCREMKDEADKHLCQMGITVTNALSSWVRVDIWKPPVIVEPDTWLDKAKSLFGLYDSYKERGSHFQMDFCRGEFEGHLEGTPGYRNKKGTEIYFELDTSILGEVKLDADYIRETVKKYACAFGCTITVRDHRV